LGFLFSSWLTGRLIHGRKMNLFALYGCFSLGILVIYIMGALQLSFFMNRNLATAFSLGILPFILPDCAKVFLASLGYAWIRPRL